MSNALPNTEPILILTTGGTIDKVYFDALSQYQVGESAVARLLAMARVTHPYRIEEVMCKDSLDLTADDRAQIANRVRESQHHRIVITHGTDTITDTARALSALALETRKTVVLTGALAPARFSESDAAFNLGMAFAAAQAALPGAYITINGSIFQGVEVVKDRERGSFTRTPVPGSS